MKITYFDMKINQENFQPEITFILEGTINPENIKIAELFGDDGYAIFGKEFIDLIKEKIKQHQTKIRTETNKHGTISYFWD